GELLGREGRPDPAAELIADRVHRPLGVPRSPRVGGELPEPARALLPLEERVVERVGHPYLVAGGGKLPGGPVAEQASGSSGPVIFQMSTRPAPAMCWTLRA